MKESIIKLLIKILIGILFITGFINNDSIFIEMIFYFLAFVLFDYYSYIDKKFNYKYNPFIK